VITYLSRYRYWQIITGGLLAAVAGIWVVAFAAVWAAHAWPQAADGIHSAYFIVAAIAAWVIIGIFTEAALLKRRTKQVQAALDRVMDIIAGHTKEADRG
jgi:hypothetical protein